MSRAADAATSAEELQVVTILEGVDDPELPGISIVDLGIVRKVGFSGDSVGVTITPTFSGCPAMDMIRTEIGLALSRAGYVDYTIDVALNPPWTSDWMTERAKLRIKELGMSPPTGDSSLEARGVCPRCGSKTTRVLNFFGSTACKSLYYCVECTEPFEQFKTV